MNITTLSLGGKIAVCWSFMWRGMLITIGSAIVGGLLGGLLGFLVAETGIARHTGAQLAQVVATLAGGLTGCVFLYLYVRWLLTAQLGRYRLLLVPAHAAADRRGPDTEPMAR
ncbi:MAG: hypothetical protein ACO1PB_01735 [Ramlibacter sp.]